MGKSIDTDNFKLPVPIGYREMVDCAVNEYSFLDRSGVEYVSGPGYFTKVEDETYCDDLLDDYPESMKPIDGEWC